jgi:superfamily II DNA or RNA helicase
MKALIGKDGLVYINKNSIPHTEYLRIRANLINIIPFSGSKFNKSEINLYNETKSGYMMLPKAYGIREAIKLGLGNILFKNNMIVKPQPFSRKYISSTISLYEYQLDTVDTIYGKYKMGCFGGIIGLSTGSGKTYTSLAIANKIGNKCLIVVTNRSMAEQWKKDINTMFSSEASIISSYRDKEKGIASFTDFTICVRNTLALRKNNTYKYTSDDLSIFGTVIIDEIHVMLTEKTLSMFNVISKSFIMGITATTKKLNNLHYLMDYYIGPILYEYFKSYKGCKPEIYMIKYVTNDKKKYNKLFKFKQGSNKGKINYTTTFLNMLSDPNRINSACKCIEEQYRKTHIKRILVLIQYKAIIDSIYTNLIDEVKEYTGIFYSGVNDIENTLTGKKIILAVSALGEQSLNLPDCNCLIMITPPIMKLDINNEWNTEKLTQSIGRVMRKEWDKSPEIYVFNDMYSFFARHYITRLLFFEKIQKYKVYKSNNIDINDISPNETDIIYDD